jgi:hypothetical protein
MNIEQRVLVVDLEIATEFAFAQEICECDARSNRYSRAELLPSLAAIIQSVD